MYACKYGFPGIPHVCHLTKQKLLPPTSYRQRDCITTFFLSSGSSTGSMLAQIIPEYEPSTRDAVIL